ncbi:MAG TPA: AMP-binding protein [Streptosporangiaceae bacterium]
MRTIPAELVTRYEAEGWWTRDTMGDLLARGLAAVPGADFRVHSAVRPWAGTIGEVELVARRLAGGLRERGVGPGDVVAFQLPNWMEAAAVFWASAFLGAVVVPIVHFYGRKEVGFILDTIRPRVFVTAERFGHLDYQPDLSAAVPIVGVVSVAGQGEASRLSSGTASFDDLLSAEPMPGVVATDPAGPAVIAFTSGTTRDPKGVVHSHQTLGFETRQLGGRYPADWGPQLISAPVGHFIGMLGAFLIPVLSGLPINIADAWDPARVLALMASDGLAVGGGAAYYMTSLLDHPDFTPGHLRYLRYAGLGGSSIPAVVTTRLASLGITVWRSYGSTEHPSITGSQHTAPQDKRLFTDGNAMPGVEFRLAEDGEVISRGPDLCLGYTDPELTRAAFDDEGWYRTGDLGELDDDGYLTITGRKSDVIIRGGENISAMEVEEVLLDMPGVAEAAVVAAPDLRLGEHVAAFVRVLPGRPAPTMEHLRAHFEQAGLARPKWPEELHVLDDFPRTASGKVQKYILRADIAAPKD